MEVFSLFSILFNTKSSISKNTFHLHQNMSTKRVSINESSLFHHHQAPPQTSNKAVDQKPTKTTVEKDLASLLFAAPDPNNQSNVSYVSATDQSRIGGANSGNTQKTIHVFPPSETVQQRASIEAREQMSKIRKVASGKVFRQNPDTSANLMTEANSKLFETEKNIYSVNNNSDDSHVNNSTASHQHYNAALSPNASLQLVIDSAKDGDCVYVQPGTHDLKEPLYISSKKKIFIIGFVESHTESAAPTLRMRVTAPRNNEEQDRKEGKSHLFAQFEKKYSPITPMLKIQQGAEVFLSHMKFEYIVEFPDEEADRSEMEKEELAKLLKEEDENNKKNTRKFSQYVGFGNASKSNNNDEADELEEEHIMLPEDRRKAREEKKRQEELKRLNQKSPEQLAKEKEERRLSKLREGAVNLPLKATVIEIVGAGTQVTLNHCAILSDCHGIHFRCTSTKVTATGTSTASPRLAIRDQCYFECPFGTALIAVSEDETGYASHLAARVDPMSPPKDTLRHPEGILHISRSAFSLCQCACEFTGPLHIKIADCDFDGCDIGVNATTCLQMQISISETLFSKCSIAGALFDAPAGSGSTRDVLISDSRFDFCERGIIFQGADSAAQVDTCVITRSKKCGVLMDGGRSSVINSVLQQNDVAVEIIEGKSSFSNNTFHANSAAAVLVTGNGTTPTLRENTFTNTGETGPQVGGMRLNALSRLQQEDNGDDDNNNNNNHGEDDDCEADRNEQSINSNTGTSSHYSTNSSYAMALKNNEIGFEKGTTLRSSSSSLNAHRRTIRCAAIFVEQDATPLVEYNRFEGNHGANVLVVGGLGVFTDNALGTPATDSYNFVVSGLRACPRLEHNVICGNDRGQARPTVVVEDGAAAIVQLNDFTHGSSSAVVLRRSGPQTLVAQNRISRFLEGIVVMERSQGISKRNSMGRLNVEVFSDSKDSFDVL